MKKRTAGKWATKHCRPCEGGVKSLSRSQARETLRELPGWDLAKAGREIRKVYRFKNFKEVIAFFNRIAAIAEDENHHPDLKVSYSRVEVSLSTHAIKGLSDNDFILAAKFDKIRPTSDESSALTFPGSRRK